MYVCTFLSMYESLLKNYQQIHFPESEQMPRQIDNFEGNGSG